MYSVAIADDEIGIREGLRDLVAWDALGFSVAGVFEDGEDLLAWMETAAADLVVTDIKMSRRSGLEVSAYIQEHHPGTRVVLISGYKEADLAMSAIKHGVRDYILKPIDLDELHACLGRMRRELDEERDARSRLEELDRARSNMADMRELFFEELIIGSLQNLQLIRRMFELIYPDLSFADSTCFSLDLCIHQYDSFIRDEWTHSRSELHSYIGNFVAIATRDMELQLLTKRGDRLELFGLLRTKPGGCVRQVVEQGVEALCGELRATFGVRVEVAGLVIWDSIPVMLEGRKAIGSTSPTQALEQLNEQQRILYSILREGDRELIGQATAKFAACLADVEITIARDVTRDLLYTVSAKLREDGLTPAAALAISEAFSRLDEVADRQGLDQVIKKTFGDLCTALQDGQNGMVERAKAYIMQHISDDISLEDIAERFYLSQYHFSRTFKAKTGETLISFIIRCKMEYAMELLRTTHLKIYEVCERSGYRSLRHFTKLFKSHTGMTPSAYRQQKHIER